MTTVRGTIIGLLGLATLGLSQGAWASDIERVDFRHGDFTVHWESSGSLDAHEITGSYDGATYTVSAWDGEREALLWWDPIDGLGIRGGSNDDEIDGGEALRIGFSSSVHLRTLTFSDLFLDEIPGGEQGYLVLDTATPVNFSAGSLVAMAAGNGEYRLVLPEMIEVTSLQMSANGESSDFALRGFGYQPGPTDRDKDPTAQPASVPAPGLLALLAAGLLAMGASGRRRSN